MLSHRPEPVISPDMPVIERSELEVAHVELDSMYEALGELNAEATWRLIMRSVEHTSRARMKQHLAILLVIALQRLKSVREGEGNATQATHQGDSGLAGS